MGVPKETETSAEQDISTSNIFEDFNDDTELQGEVEQINEQAEKDLYYYVGKAGKVLQSLFLLGVVLSFVVYAYIYIQKDASYVEKSFLDPVCQLMIGDIPMSGSYCSSISGLHEYYTLQLEENKQKQSTTIFSLLDRLYVDENFLKTKGVSFLKYKSDTKLPILEILSAFDNLKTDFDSIEKEKIKCGSVSITNEGILEMECSSFSAGYESGIRGFDSGAASTVRGTSISIANSFLNYIEKQGDNFELIDRQKIFTATDVTGELQGFTHQTNFSVQLKYKTNNLSL